MIDLISRQAAIKTAHLPVIDDAGYEVVRVNDILALPPAQPVWIPYTPESEPKRCEYYLVTNDGYTEEAYLDCDGVWFSLYGNKLKDVTAWMEKPEPWEGGQDG